MIYQESVMRVAQKFAGYSLAEADSLRKAMGKKIREAMEKERAKFVDGVVATGYDRDLGVAAVRHHRPVRRLRLQQEPLLRLRLHRLPDRLPQGALPGPVPGGAAHQRQDEPRQGGGLPQRVPGDGHRGRWCPTSTGPGWTSTPSPPARRRATPGWAPSCSACRRSATSARASSSSCWPSATPTVPSTTSTTSASGSTPRC